HKILDQALEIGIERDASSTRLSGQVRLHVRFELQSYSHSVFIIPFFPTCGFRWALGGSNPTLTATAESTTWKPIVAFLLALSEKNPGYTL
ncbi:MAG TPA: hypothetical protein VN203_00435, partial [Candidatus Acidoferrum sp.]|nr:hypothetical protein [Candidatus Acidoferrum sp.]